MSSGKEVIWILQEIEIFKNVFSRAKQTDRFHTFLSCFQVYSRDPKYTVHQVRSSNIPISKFTTNFDSKSNLLLYFNPIKTCLTCATKLDTWTKFRNCRATIERTREKKYIVAERLR